MSTVVGSEVLEGTRGRILGELAAQPCTARDLASSLGIRESAARGHLDRLEQRGYIVPSFRKEGVGRPRKRYTLTGEGQELFPKKYDLLLDALIDEIVARQGEAAVRELLAEAARKVARSIASGIPPGGSVEERTARLVRELNEFGFGCSMERTPDGGTRIMRTNCVFRRSAISHTYLMCNVFDQHLTEELLGRVGVDLQDSIARGGMRCSHLIHLQ
ncbi:MAG: helix-turn-helix transcriptional regulator [Thermoplasmata archaeon]